jgi:1-acyl-sn-glycerol-3-phosphate acyltransferase
VIVLAETRETDPVTRAMLVGRITDCVAPILGGAPEHVALLPPRSIPKTSSGKLRRSTTLERYRSGGLASEARPVWRQGLDLVLLGAAGRLRARSRRALTWAHAIWWWLTIGAAMTLVWAMVFAMPECPARANLLRRLARGALMMAGNPLTVRGLDRLPTGRSVLVANHSSYLDGLVLLAALPGPLSFAAKRELASQIIAGPFLRRLGCVFIERAAAAGAGGEASRLADVATSQRRLVVFPEGTFDRAPGLLPFRLGAFQVAVSAHVPVVPVALRGARDALRGDQWLPRPGPIEVEVLAAQLPKASGFAGALALSQSVRGSLLAALDEPDRGAEAPTIPLPSTGAGT